MSKVQNLSQSVRSHMTRIVPLNGGYRAQCTCGWRDRLRDMPSWAWRHAMDHVAEVEHHAV